jgi:hypothetical protein
LRPRRGSISSMKKKFIVPGIVVILAAIAVLTLVLLHKPSTASAEQLTANSLANVSSLSTGADTNLDKTIGVNAKDELKTALAAKDLQTISYAQLQKLNYLQNAPTKANLSSLKYLRYTDSKGAVHIIGLGKNDLPSLVMVFQDSTGPNATAKAITPTTTQAADNTSTNNATSSVSSTSNSVVNVSDTSTQCTGTNGQTTCTTTGSGTPNCTISGNTTTCESHEETNSNSSASDN